MAFPQSQKLSLVLLPLYYDQIVSLFLCLVLIHVLLVYWK
jgi:hypothetical protein